MLTLNRRSRAATVTASVALASAISTGIFSLNAGRAATLPHQRTTPPSRSSHHFRPDVGESVIYSFQGGTSDGGAPNSVLYLASGAFYGTTTGGGGSGYGTVYKVTLSGSTYTDTILHSFQGPTSDGSEPFFGVITDSNGAVYGTTPYGGNASCGGSGCGTVYKINSSGTESILYNFQGGTSDGSEPETNLIADSNGALYGVTRGGGTDGDGTAFKLTPTLSGYTETILYNFQGGTSDGANPVGGLVADSSGNLYGDTEAGGTSSSSCLHGSSGCGTVFKLALSNGSYTESVIHFFQGPPNDGDTGQKGLIDLSGTFYGTTQHGGNTNCNVSCGTVYKLTASGSGYLESVLYRFQGGSDGEGNMAGVAGDNAGALYGTTAFGGGSASCTNGCGTVFKLTSSPLGGYTESILHSFQTNGNSGDGASPYGGVILVPNIVTPPTIYGTTRAGGSAGDGTVFKITQ